jgi:T-complex protein 1 subunit delta
MLCGHHWVLVEWTRWLERFHPKVFLASFLSPSSQIQTSKGEVIVTNDGATILQSIQALHPASKMVSGRTSLDPNMVDIDAFGQLVDLSAAQDVEAGDGTTSVVVLAGSLLGAAEKMLQKGIHPTIIAESFLKASAKAVEFLTDISTPIDLNDRTTLIRAASTSLNSKACRISLLPVLI